LGEDNTADPGKFYRMEGGWWPPVASTESQPPVLSLLCTDS